MKKLFVCFSLLGALSLPSFAGVSANVGFATDYIWRGMTQTSGDPAMSGGFDYASDGGFYAGIWGSNVSLHSNPRYLHKNRHLKHNRNHQTSQDLLKSVSFLSKYNLWQNQH